MPRSTHRLPHEFGVTIANVPLNFNAIYKFITEEVQRQGHDLFVFLDGGIRTVWMSEAWGYALSCRYGLLGESPCRFPSLAQIVEIARLIEPEKNSRGIRTLGVRVGLTICPPSVAVPMLLNILWEKINDVDPKQGLNKALSLSPDEFYVEFERIHPFADGNGRIGKILHNWLLGTLNDPVLIADYFGGGNP